VGLANTPCQLRRCRQVSTVPHPIPLNAVHRSCLWVSELRIIWLQGDGPCQVLPSCPGIMHGRQRVQPPPTAAHAVQVPLPIGVRQDALFTNGAGVGYGFHPHMGLGTYTERAVPAGEPG